MTVPPGWYPDPAPGSSLQRFWDGSTWTQETRPVGQAEPSPAPAPDVPSVEPSTEPSAAAAPEPVEGEEGPSRRGRRRRSARAPEPAEGEPASESSRAERRLERSLLVLEDRRSAPLFRQAVRAGVDLALALALSFPLAILLAPVLALPPTWLALVLAGPALVLLRAAAALSARPSPGEFASSTRAVIAVSGRVLDVPAAVRSALLPSALLAAASLVPAALPLLLLDLLSALRGGDVRQILSDRLSGIQLVRT